MAEQQTVVRKNLTEKLEKIDLVKDVLFATSFRAVKDNQIQMEVVQRRRISGRKRNLLGILNQSDKRFGSASTLLFDWLLFPVDVLLKAFPQLAEKGWTEAKLQAIADSYDPNGPTGSDANVFPAVVKLDHGVDPEEGDKFTPVIAVTEITHSQLIGKEFFRGPNADEKIENELTNGTAVMKTSADGEYIVDGESGDKIYRFTQVVPKEDYNDDYDTIIPNKMTESAYKASLKSKVKSNQGQPLDNAEDIENAILGDSQL